MGPIKVGPTIVDVIGAVIRSIVGPVIVETQTQGRHVSHLHFDGQSARPPESRACTPPVYQVIEAREQHLVHSLADLG